MILNVNMYGYAGSRLICFDLREQKNMLRQRKMEHEDNHIRDKINQPCQRQLSKLKNIDVAW